MQVLICTYIIYNFSLDCMTTFMLIYYILSFFFNNQNLKFLALKVSVMVLKYEGSYGSVTYITNINQFSIRLLMLITASVCI